MPQIHISNSEVPATYVEGSLELEHNGSIYLLSTPLVNIEQTTTGELTEKGLLIIHGIRYHLVEKESHQRRLQQLRALRFKYAPRVAMLSRIIQMAAKELVKIENAIDDQATEIDGGYYRDRHTLGFETRGANADQVELDGFVITPDFQSVLKTAIDTAAEAMKVSKNSLLPSEVGLGK